MQFITATQNHEQLFRNAPKWRPAFREWQFKLRRGERLPRGKYFRGKNPGRPIMILDELWSATNSGY